MVNGLRLLILNLLWMVLVIFAMSFPPLDMAASAGFLGIIIAIGVRMRRAGLSRLSVAGIAALSQIPGLLLTAASIHAWVEAGPVSSDYDFMLQFWHAAWVPLLSLSRATVGHITVGYLANYVLSIIYIALMTFAGDLFALIAGIGLRITSLEKGKICLASLERK